MKKQTEIIAFAVSVILKSALIAAASAGKSRRSGLESNANMPIDEKDKEILFLSNHIFQRETQIKIFQKQIQSSSCKTRYNQKERLFMLWHMEYFLIPRRRVREKWSMATNT